MLWEELRPKQTTKEQKQQLVAQIVKKVCWHAWPPFHGYTASWELHGFSPCACSSASVWSA